MFPIVLSAPEPFYLFVRDDADEWNVTIEQINTSTYDPLKLHRVSFFLDVGLEHGTPMGFGFDGSMIIPRNTSLRSADDAMDCFNRVKASMLLGGLVLEETTSSELAFGEMSNLGYYRYQEPHGAASRFNRALGESAAGSLLSIVLDDPRRISKAKVERAYADGSQVFSHLSRLNPGFLVTAFSKVGASQHRDGLIFGWVATEQVIEHLWIDLFLSDSKYYRSEERKKNLSSIRNVGQKIEMLHQADLVTHEAYQTLSKARRARNNFAHNGRRVDREEAMSCLRGLLMTIDAYSLQSGLPSLGTGPLAAVDAGGSNLPTKNRTLQGVARNLNFEGAKYWREIFAIPGDEKWSGDSEKLDGIRIADASAEIKSAGTKPSKKKKP